MVLLRTHQGGRIRTIEPLRTRLAISSTNNTSISCLQLPCNLDLLPDLRLQPEACQVWGIYSWSHRTKWLQTQRVQEDLRLDLKIQSSRSVISILKFKPVFEWWPDVVLPVSEGGRCARIAIADFSLTTSRCKRSAKPSLKICVQFISE